MTQSRKNIRAALLGQNMAFGSPAWQASQAAVRYVEKQAPEVDPALARLGHDVTVLRATTEADAAAQAVALVRGWLAGNDNEELFSSVAC